MCRSENLSWQNPYRTDGVSTIILIQHALVSLKRCVSHRTCVVTPESLAGLWQSRLEALVPSGHPGCPRAYHFDDMITAHRIKKSVDFVIIAG